MRKNGKRIKQQNGKGGASSDSCHENPLSLMLKDTHLVQRGPLYANWGAKGGGEEGSVKPTRRMFPFPTLTVAACKFSLKVIRGNSFGLASQREVQMMN